MQKDKQEKDTYGSWGGGCDHIYIESTNLDIHKYIYIHICKVDLYALFDGCPVLFKKIKLIKVRALKAQFKQFE